MASSQTSDTGLRRFLPDGFVLALIAAVGLALVAPEIGASGGPIPLGPITEAGIALVFFLHGVNLSPQALKAGAQAWKLHIVVQLCTFGLFPLLGALIYVGTADFIAPEMRLGFFYLCALSTTISSSVATVSMAQGNIPAAIFNVTLSSLAGMLVTPALIALLQTTGTAHQLPLGDTVIDIATKLLLPFVAGQLLRRWLVGFVSKHKPVVTKLDRGVILLIVYAAFCNSTAQGIWSRYPATTMIIVAALVIVMLLAVIAATTLTARALGFSREDEITAVFCGSQKSLANGAPIAKIIFGANPALGAILLPLMLYHPLQLVACSALARRYVRRGQAEAPVAAAVPANG